jgi:hypothetical protein
MARTTTAVVAVLVTLMGAARKKKFTPPLEERGSASGAAPTRLIHVDRTTLKSYDLESGETSEIAQLPSTDVAVSPDGRAYRAYVVVRETSKQ